MPPRLPGVWIVSADPSTETTLPVTEPWTGDAAAAGAMSAATTRQQLTIARFVINPQGAVSAPGAMKATPTRTNVRPAAVSSGHANRIAPGARRTHVAEL